MTTPIVARHDLTLAEIDALEHRLYGFNIAATGHDDGEALSFVVLDASGAIAGAAVGHSWGGVAELKTMFLDEGLRGQGLGIGLIEAFVAEARVRGVHTVWVMSFDFQAPALYERCGFQRVVELGPWPEGHVQVVLKRTLAAAPSS